MSRLLEKKKDGKYPFQYRDSASTDVAVTWQRAREQLEKDKKECEEKVREIKQIGVKNGR